MRDLIIVTGQTATGKSDLALQLATQHNGEILNADSRQIYKHLDIVTGKDLPLSTKSEVAYHLFDIIDPKDRFSSYDYARQAAAAIQSVRRRGKTPIIVGGAYLYLSHLLYGFDVHVEPDQKLRDKLEDKSVAELQQLLAPRPPDINDSDWNNPRRLIRRIEINRSPNNKSDSRSSPLHPRGEAEHILLFIGLKHVDRISLETAISNRVQNRIAEGAVQEVKDLLKKGYSKEDPGLQTIGYTQIIAYLSGDMHIDAAIKQWTTKEIQYAKRQYTFMKKDSSIKWQTI